MFAPAWNHSHTSIPLVPTEPSCGCGHILNSDMVEGNIALIERGECSFVSKVGSKSTKTLTKTRFRTLPSNFAEAFDLKADKLQSKILLVKINQMSETMTSA